MRGIIINIKFIKRELFIFRVCFRLLLILIKIYIFLHLLLLYLQLLLLLLLLILLLILWKFLIWLLWRDLRILSNIIRLLYGHLNLNILFSVVKNIRCSFAGILNLLIISWRYKIYWLLICLLLEILFI